MSIRNHALMLITACFLAVAAGGCRPRVVRTGGAVEADILAWSRSPSWSFKIPFDLFVSGDKPLSVPSGFAPVFGPVIEMFFYFNFFLVCGESLALGRVLDGRLEEQADERPLLNPPFEIDRDRPLEMIITWLVLPGTLLLSILVLGDFLNLSYTTPEGGHSVWRLLLPLSLDGVSPTHRGHAVGTMVYGFWQPWLYVLFLVFKILVVIYVMLDIRAYCQVLQTRGRTPSRFAEWLNSLLGRPQSHSPDHDSEARESLREPD